MFGSIKISIEGVKNSKGQLLLSVFTKAEGFPFKPDSTIKIKKDSLFKNNTIKYEIKKLAHGEYAFAICDDENFNDTMNYNRIGIPCEGFGFSNNVTPLISAPKYKLCKFNLDSSEIEIKINLIYKNTYHEKIPDTDSICSNVHYNLESNSR